MKKLVEKRNELVEKVNALFASAEAETRSFNDEETSKYDDYMKEIADLDAQMKRIEEQRALTKVNFEEPKEVVVEEEPKVDVEVEETRAFEQYVRELRAENMTLGANGAVIPTTIANKIIEKVENIAPLYALATKFNVKGDLSFPVAEKEITTGYQQEFTEIESSSVGFKSVTLGSFLVGALSKVSMSLVNNSQFDIVSYVINEVAESIAKFLEKELISGAGSNAVTGIMTSTDIAKVQTTDITDVDKLIEAQTTVPQTFQGACRWLMNNKTLIALRQVKDKNGRYLLQDDVTNGFGYTLLGKPVMISDNMVDDKIVYGDFSAMYVNIHKDVTVQVMRERYLPEHALGVIAWLELDGKVVEPQKLVTVQKGE